jgi:hypothetical protein
MPKSAPQPVLTGSALDLADSVPFRNQLSVEADTGVIKVGDGVTTHLALPISHDPSLSGSYSPLTPPSAGTALYAYGSSFVVGGNNSTLAASFVNRVNTLGQFASVSNRGLSGATVVENAFDALTGAHTGVPIWTPGTKGIVIVDAVINSIQLWGNDARGIAAAGNALRTLCALIRSSSKVESSDASFAYTGTWTTNTLSVFSGGDAKATTVAGSYVDVTFTGTEQTSF